MTLSYDLASLFRKGGQVYINLIGHTYLDTREVELCNYLLVYCLVADYEFTDDDDPGYIPLYEYLVLMYSTDNDTIYDSSIGLPSDLPCDASPAEISQLEAAIRKLVFFEPEKRDSAEEMARDQFFSLA